jgi:hypothetical protein
MQGLFTDSGLFIGPRRFRQLFRGVGGTAASQKPIVLGAGEQPPLKSRAKFVAIGRQLV